MNKYIYKNKVHSFKKVLAVIITAGFLIFTITVSVQAAQTEKCGDEVTWKLENGELTISGTGGMTNYTEESMAPWYGQKEEIKTIVIEDGVTRIGNLAFFECTSLQSVRLSDSVTEIGDTAFAGCNDLRTVSFGLGLNSIGNYAFSRCESLNGVRLPEKLLSIGYQAFYRCGSLSSIRIPASTTNLYSGIFSYCDSLLQVIIESPITELPPWIFYGCTSLSEVALPYTTSGIGENAFYGCDSIEHIYHDGSETIRQQITDQIQESIPDFSGVTKGDASDIGSSSTTTTASNPEGGVIKTDQEVIDGENVTIDITIEHKKPEMVTAEQKNEIQVTINGILEEKDGWEDLLDQIRDYIKFPERFTDETTAVHKMKVSVLVKGNEKLPGRVLEELAGQKVTLSILTDNQTRWYIDCETIDGEKLSKSYDLEFTVTKNKKPTKAQKKLIGNAESYLVEFEDSVPFQVTIELPFGYSYGGQYGTFCQKAVLKSWEQKQTVVIDHNGKAFFYLDSIDKHTDYLVAINMKGALIDQALVPDSLSGQFEGLMDQYGNQYVLTGTKSSWGISFTQLTLIVLGMILVSGAVVGVIVRMQYKAKQIKKKETDGRN